MKNSCQKWNLKLLFIIEKKVKNEQKSVFKRRVRKEITYRNGKPRLTKKWFES